jgi:hypothetical protein
MDYLIVSGLIAEVLLLSRLDRRIFGTWFTPFNLLAYPYMVVLVSAFLLAPALGFVSVYTPSILIWIVGLFLFWAIGAFLGWGLFGGTSIAHPFASAKNSCRHESSATKLAITLAWAIIPLMAYGLYKSETASGGWTELGSYDFRVEYSHGIDSHAVVLAFPLAILLMGTYRKGRRLQLVTIGGLLLFLFASQVKGTLLAPLIGALVFRGARGDLKLSLSKLVAAVGATYVLFNAVYLLGLSFADPNVLTDSEIYGSLARHYLYYLWAGVLAFSQAMRLGVGRVGGPWYEVFSPFINLYRVSLSAGPLVPAGSPHELGMNVDPTIPDLQGMNVYTMLGTLDLYLGPLATLLVVFCIALLFYGLLLVCRSSANLWYLTLYCFLVSWLVFGFFEYYFWHLTYLEIIGYCLVLAIFHAGARWRPTAKAYGPITMNSLPKVS